MKRPNARKHKTAEATAVLPVDHADALRTTARERSRDSNWVDAAEAWQRLLDVVPGDFEAHYRIAQAQFHLGRIEQAAEFARKAWLQVPQDARPGLIVARAQHRLRQWAEAAQSWQALAALEPQSFEHRFRLAQALAQLGQRQAAIDSVQRALKLKPGDEESQRLLERVSGGYVAPDTNALNQDSILLLAEARDLSREKRWGEAEAAWTRFLEQSPRDFEGLYRLAQAQHAQNNLASALKAATRAATISPSDPRVQTLLGRLLVEVRDWQGAEACWWQIASGNADDFEAAYRLGQCLLEQGKLADARKWLGKANALRPEHEGAALLLSRSRARGNVLKVKKLAGKRAGKKAATVDIQSFIDNGRAQIQAKDWIAAEASWWSVLAERPDDFEANYRIGQCLLEQGDVGEAAKWVRKALGVRPEHEGAALLLGRIKSREKVARQLPAQVQVQAVSGKDALVEQILHGRMLVQNKEWEAAEAVWWQILSHNPDDFEPIYRLGHCLLELGNRTDAKKWLQQARKLRPDHENVVTLLTRIRLAEAATKATKATPAKPRAGARPYTAQTVQALMDQGDIAAAAAKLQVLLAAAPDDEALLVLQKRLARRAAAKKAGGAPAQEVSQPTPADDKAATSTELFIEARAALGSKNWPLAAELWSRVVKELPESFEAHYRLAHARTELGDTAMAIAHATRASELRPEHTANLVLLSRAYQRAALLHEAVDTFRRVLAIDPAHFDARHRLGQVLLSLNRLDEAEIEFGLALDARPDALDCHENLATAIARSGRIGVAVQRWNAFIDQWPGNARAMRKFLAFLRTHKQHDLVEGLLRRLVAASPNELDGIYLLSAHLAAKQRWDEVLSLLEPVIDKLEDDSLAIKAAILRTYGWAKDSVGDVVTAERCFRDSLALEPNNLSTITRLARVLRQTGKSEEALAYRRRACDLDPQDVNNWHEYIFLLASLERETEARKALAEAESILPVTAANLARFGRICEGALFFDQANAYFARAIELDESMILQAGLYFARNGVVDKALDYLLRAREVSSNSVDTVKALITQLRIGELLDKTPAQLKRLGKKRELLTPELLFEHMVDKKLAPPAYIPVAGRVVLITGSLGAGGAERQLVTTIRGLTKHPNLVESITLLTISLNKRFKRDFYLADIEKLPIAIRSVEDSLARDAAPAMPPHYAALVDAFPDDMRDSIKLWYHDFLENKPAVVHAWQDSTALTAVVAAALAGVPRILLSTRSTRPDNPRRRLKRYMQRAYMAVMRLPNVYMLNNSQAGGTDYEQWLSLPAGTVEVIYNGIDFDKLLHAADDKEAAANRKRFGIPKNAPVLGGVFRMSEEKRPLLWVDTAAEVLKRVPSVHCVVAGDGPMRDEMIERAQQLGIAERLHLPGHVQVASWFRIMDVVLLTSRMEGLPNVLLEAQSFGIPVVAPAVGGVAETIWQGKTGWALPNATATKMAEKIAYAMTDTKWYQGAQQRAATFAKDNYSVEAMVDKTLKAYDCTAAPTTTGNATLAETPLTLAQQAFERKDYDAAHGLLDELSRTHGTDVTVWRWLGRTLQAKGEAAHAVAAWRKVLTTAPEDFEAQFRLAEQLARGGEERAAVSLLRKALLQNPTHDAALRQLARLLQHLNQPQEALSLWTLIAAQRADDFEAAYRGGQLALATGDSQHGCELLEQAQRLSPKHFKPVELLARHAMWQGELRKARKLLVNYLRRGDESLEAIGLLGKVLTLQGRQRLLQRLLASLERLSAQRTADLLRCARWQLGFGEYERCEALLGSCTPVAEAEQRLHQLLSVAVALARHDFAAAVARSGEQPSPEGGELVRDHATTLRLLGADATASLQTAFVQWWERHSKQTRAPVYAPVKGSVLHVVNSLAMGGTEKQAAITAAMQTAAALEFGPVTLLRVDPANTGRAVFFLPYALDHHINTGTLDELGGNSGAATPLDGLVSNGNFRRALGLPETERLYRAFLQTQPAVVHAWTPQTAVQCTIAGLLAGVPRIVLRMGSVAPDQRPDLSPDDKVLYRWFRQVLRAGLKDKRVRLVSNCSVNLDGWLAWLGLSAGKCGAKPMVTPNLVDISLLGSTDDKRVKALRTQLQIKPKQTVIGTVARFEPEKGMGLWLDCVAAARKQLPAAVFLLIGNGRMKDELLEQINRRQLGRHVRMITDAGATLAPYYALMDVYLQTSLVEGLPNAVLEAKAFGLPIVATDVGGTREAVGNVHNTRLSNPNSEELVTGLSQLVPLKKSKTAPPSQEGFTSTAVRSCVKVYEVEK